MNEIHDEEPKIKHAYLTKGDGSPLMFIELAEGDTCPLCSRGAIGTPMAILVRTPRDEVVHCTKCDYQITRVPRLTQHRFRPMNSGMRNDGQ